MTQIQITLTLPLLDVIDEGAEYVRGFVAATLAPIHADIDNGVLDLHAMFDAGWELDIPSV